MESEQKIAGINFRPLEEFQALGPLVLEFIAGSLHAEL